jgi:hypothetical protein
LYKLVSKERNKRLSDLAKKLKKLKGKRGYYMENL